MFFQLGHQHVKRQRSWRTELLFWLCYSLHPRWELLGQWCHRCQGIIRSSCDRSGLGFHVLLLRQIITVSFLSTSFSNLRYLHIYFKQSSNSISWRIDDWSRSHDSHRRGTSKWSCECFSKCGSQVVTAFKKI